MGTATYVLILWMYGTAGVPMLTVAPGYYQTEQLCEIAGRAWASDQQPRRSFACIPAGRGTAP